MKLFGILLLSILSFCVQSQQKYRCYWHGTSPFCDMPECENGYRRIIACRDEDWYCDYRLDEAKFGVRCWLGFKSLCCHPNDVEGVKANRRVGTFTNNENFYPEDA
ncbi:hypothetical protein AYI70_g8983 [Smittium culicis]|uniref:Uncharacterized protein n=1 Tax=Smittium culicis TaxID=133412 RepID=A0A1R1XDG7_9FUNG|nr:hypothetical protein AYI70_g8983 [Smittium culicis]